MPKNPPLYRVVAQNLGFVPKNDWGFKVHPMVSWFAPGTLAKAALRAVLTNVIGQYGDRREFQGGIDQATPFDYSQDGDRWIDFVADSGDGFESTFAVARLLTEDLDADDDPTESGSILLFGGDQVYPDAHDRG